MMRAAGSILSSIPNSRQNILISVARLRLFMIHLTVVIVDTMETRGVNDQHHHKNMSSSAADDSSLVSRKTFCKCVFQHAVQTLIWNTTHPPEIEESHNYLSDSSGES